MTCPDPELTAVLDRRAADGDFWVRRAALLSLLRPLRRREAVKPLPPETAARMLAAYRARPRA